MNRILPAIMIFALCASAWGARPFQVEDMQKLSRVSDAQLSPDGNWVVFTVQQSDVSKNKSVRNLWLIASKGGNPTQLTFATDKGSNSAGRWSPDSKYIYFISSRVEDTPQIFRMALSGGEAKQITKFALGVDAYVISPDGMMIAFLSTVFPECSDPACNEKKKKEVEENPVKAQIITSVPFRRWDTWNEGKRNHIFVIPSDGGEAKDLTPGDVDSPIWSEGDSQEFDFSPDSKEICFSRFTQSEGFSGNSDLFTVPVQGGTPKQITTNPAADSTPLYSPDGNYIAYSATLRPGLESDLVRLFLYDRKAGRQINLFEKLDRSIGSYYWTRDGKALWITIEDQGQYPILKMQVSDGKATKVYPDGLNTDVQVSEDSEFITYTHNDLSHPTEIFRLDVKNSSKPIQVTNFNTEFLKEIQFGEYNSFTFPGWQGETVQCWQVKPPFFDSSKKYPLLLLMHGGPENAWDNLFHYRWNAQLFAAAGYVVIGPNFHGSSGFGLKFMDAIKGQWGGAPYEDQRKAVDVAITWPYVDPTRLVAAGASYGGYMANWIEGHTDRFRAIVSHDGLYDLNTALYAADFPGGTDKEFKGTPWENPEALLQHAPATYAKNFKTPMLVIHGLKDYRVDPSNGFAMFQVLQAMKVPSKFLLFPDENHWVLKPANNVLWYHTVLDWLNYWSKPDQQQYQTLLKQESSKMGGAP
jgi:dipeptidyl aminopeptidase/acylaminoacyl peptidase